MIQAGGPPGRQDAPHLNGQATARDRARWALRDDEELSPVAKLAWYTLDARGEDPRPSRATLARNCGVGRGIGLATLKRALRELEETGWLRITRRTAPDGDSDTNRYELTSPHEGWGLHRPNPSATRQNISPRRSKGGGVPTDPTGGVPTDPTVGSPQTPEDQPEDPQQGLGGRPPGPPLGTRRPPDPQAGGTGSPRTPPVSRQDQPADRALPDYRDQSLSSVPDGPHHDRTSTVVADPADRPPDGAGTVRADPAGARVNGDRPPRERAGKARACARPDCGEPVTGDPRKVYCSDRCRDVQEQRRRRERRSGHPVTPAGVAKTEAARAAAEARRDRLASQAG